EDLDERRRRLRLHDRARAHARRAGEEARGAVAAPRRPEGERHHDPAHPRPRGPRPLLRGDLRGRGAPGRRAGRRGGAGLGAGDGRAGVRAERPRALPLVLPAPPRADGAAGARRDRAPARADRLRGRAAGHAPRDVAVGHWHAGRRGESRPRGLGREGPGSPVRAGAPRDGAVADRADAVDGRGRQRLPPDARSPRTERAVVLAPRRHARDPARHHRARAGAPMSELRGMLEETVGRLFGERVTKELIEAAERGEWPQALWDAVEANGLTRPHLPEDAGGAGGTWREAFVIL